MPRGKKTDNFSIKLFKALNDWVNEKMKNTVERKLKPNHNIFTHDTNLVDIYIFLDIRYKNILCMTSKVKEAPNKFKDLKIRKNYKKKSILLTKKTKEFNGGLRILSEYGYINENKTLNEFEINLLIIRFLKDKGYKAPNEVELYKIDKESISQILKEKGFNT